MIRRVACGWARGAAMARVPGMGLADIRYDLAHGAPRRIMQEDLRTWAASHPPDARILEAGAGHYNHQPYFAAPLLRFDADEAQAPDVVGDAHDMPFEDQRFDAALAVALLEHVDDPYQVVRELHRVLRPGGRIYAWIPFYFGVHGFPEDVSRFTAHGCRRLFERAGFEVTRVDCEPYSGLFHNASNTVQFVLPRRSPRRWVRILNRVLFLLARLAYPLDRRLRLHTLYAGSAVEAARR